MINWHELVLELKRKTGFSWVKLASEIGVNQWVVEDMAKGHVGDPRFSNGFALICYAGEIGVNARKVIK